MKITVSVSNAFTVIKLDLTVTVAISKNVVDRTLAKLG